MRLRFFHQRDLMDCGAVCLQSICNYYGKDIDLQYIKDLCHVTRNGVSMLGIADAAEQLGFKTIGIKLNWEQISNDVHLPCIIHWGQQHFVVVGSIQNHRITVMDPAVGILKYPKADFLNSWLNLRDMSSDEKLGAALLLSPTASFYSKIYSNAPKLHFKNLICVLSPFKSNVWRIIICMVLGCIISIIFPYLTQQIVDIGIHNSNLNSVYLPTTNVLFEKARLRNPMKSASWQIVTRQSVTSM